MADKPPSTSLPFDPATPAAVMTAQTHIMPAGHPLLRPATVTTFSPSFSSSSSSSSSTTTMAVVQSAKSMPTIASLMSPPEATPLESFARASPVSSMPAATAALQSKPLAAKPLPSPPVSPYVRTTGPDDTPMVSVPDPILYPASQETQSAASPPPPPLFVVEDDSSSSATAAAAAQQIVHAHMAARRLDATSLGTATPPHKEDYELMLNFTSRVLATYRAHPARWHAREREYLREDQRLRQGARALPQIAPRPSKAPLKPLARSPIVKTVRAPRVVAAKPARKPRESTTPEPGRTTVRTSSTREDKDFHALPDYCPPLSTLPDKPNSLKVEWKGAPLDLRADPCRHLLHDDEVLLAANLRLDCATYLTSKRRIFMARLNALRIGKEFRKTDSQQACKIDVNKASKLWIAFEKVGWLRPEYVRQFL